MYTEEINKVALNSKDNKRIQTFDKVTIFPQETPAVKVCQNEMLSVSKAKQTFKILSKQCENELYVTCNTLFNYMKTKCVSKMKKYVKLGVKKQLSYFPRYK